MQTLTCRKLLAGKVVVTQGEVGNEFFIILKGSVVVTVIDERGEESRLATINTGHYFGDLALVGPANTPRRATVTCRECCTFAVLHRSDYDRRAIYLCLTGCVRAWHLTLVYQYAQDARVQADVRVVV